MKIENQSRREFVKQTSLIASSLMALPIVSNASNFNSSVDDSIKIALIGCGGRGNRSCYASAPHQTKRKARSDGRCLS